MTQNDLTRRVPGRGASASGSAGGSGDRTWIVSERRTAPVRDADGRTRVVHDRRVTPRGDANTKTRVVRDRRAVRDGAASQTVRADGATQLVEGRPRRSADKTRLVDRGGRSTVPQGASAAATTTPVRRQVADATVVRGRAATARAGGGAPGATARPAAYPAPAPAPDYAPAGEAFEPERHPRRRTKAEEWGIRFARSSGLAILRIALRVMGVACNVLGFAFSVLVALSVFDFSRILVGTTAVRTVAARMSAALPGFLSGRWVCVVPLGGVYYGDLTCAAVILFVLSWALSNVSLRVRDLRSEGMR